MKTLFTFPAGIWTRAYPSRRTMMRHNDAILDLILDAPEATQIKRLQVGSVHHIMVISTDLTLGDTLPWGDGLPNRLTPELIDELVCEVAADWQELGGIELTAFPLHG